MSDDAMSDDAMSDVAMSRDGGRLIARVMDRVAHRLNVVACVALGWIVPRRTSAPIKLCLKDALAGIRYAS